MPRQLTIGDLCTSDAVRRAVVRGSRKSKGDERGRSREAELALQCRAAGLPTPIPQYPFAKHLGRKFAADYAFVEYRVLVEVQGGIWRRGGGAHSHPLQILRDIEKLQYCAMLGWFVLPVTTDQVAKGEALQWIERVLESRGWKRSAT